MAYLKGQLRFGTSGQMVPFLQYSSHWYTNAEVLVGIPEGIYGKFQVSKYCARFKVGVAWIGGYHIKGLDNGIFELNSLVFFGQKICLVLVQKSPSKAPFAEAFRIKSANNSVPITTRSRGKGKGSVNKPFELLLWSVYPNLATQFSLTA